MEVPQWVLAYQVREKLNSLNPYSNGSTTMGLLKLL